MTPVFFGGAPVMASPVPTGVVSVTAVVTYWHSNKETSTIKPEPSAKEITLSWPLNYPILKSYKDSPAN